MNSLTHIRNFLRIDDGLATDGMPLPDDFAVVSRHRCQARSVPYPATVSATAKTRRRRFGTLCLLTAIVMLIAGETILARHLSGVGLVLYWLGCFVVTALAAITALIDATRVRKEQREEQRALLENTLHQIEREKRSRPEAPHGS